MVKAKKLNLVERVLLSIGLLVGSANAGNLEVNTYIDNPFTSSQVIISQENGAKEGYDAKDAPWLEPMNDNVTISYSVISESPYKLGEDERPVNSTSDFFIPLDTKGSVGGETATSYINFNITDMNDFVWKNIFAERYGTSDANDVNNVIYTCDVKFNSAEPVTWDDATNLGNVPVETSGIYDQWKIRPFNHADLNRDKKVNLKDYAILANEYGKDNVSDPNRFGAYIGKDVNDLGAYADINRSGAVDMNDVSNFSYEYLWE